MMTIAPGNGMATPCRSGRTLQLHLAQLFCGPVQRALAYAYSYAYTQSSDVLSCIKKLDVAFHFTDEELQLLAKARSPKLFTISILYKIFKLCCGDKLQDCYSREWDAESLKDRPTTLEGHITALHHQHHIFTTTGGGNVDAVVASTLGVTQGVGEKLGVNKWKQQQNSLKQAVDEILEEVHPGIDVKERVANAARIEAEMRCHGISEAVSEHRARARSCSGLEEDAAMLEDVPVNIRVITQKRDRHDVLQQEESESSVSSTDMLEAIERLCTEHIDGKKICCISGAHGSGKTSLASMFPVSFSRQDGDIKRLEQYEHVVAVSGKEIEHTSIDKWVGTSKSARNDLSNFIDDYWSVVEAFLPRCSAKYGVKNVGQYLTTKKIIFIIDDAEEMSESKVKELILFLGQILFDSCVLILGNLDSITKIKFSFISFSSALHFHLHGLSTDYVLELATKFKETAKSGKKKVQKTFKDAIKINMNRIGGLLEFPELLKETLSLWKRRAAIVKELFTASELLWHLCLAKSCGAFEVNLDKDIRRRKRWFMWLMVAGENCLYCLKGNTKLNEASYAEIKECSDKLFPREESESLMNAFFKPHLVFNIDSYVSVPVSACHAQLEYLSSFFVANKLKTDDILNGYLPSTRTEEFIALITGHIKRWDTLGDTSESMEELSHELAQGIVKNLSTYEAGKFEDTQFLMKIATEFRCSHKLVQLMVNVTEYPEEWDLKLCLLSQRTLEVMLQHVAPVRIILRTDEICQNHEQLSVLKFLSKVPISVWLDSKKQFEYGNDKRMDKVLRPFLSDKVTTRLDLFSGSLSRTAMIDFPDYKSMTYIVMLALRVNDEESLSTALTLPSHLKHILWFELKIDMRIENIVLTALPPVRVEMFDVYIRDLDDLCVPQITGLLTKLHKRYSGIHLDNTTLSPESIYTLLKELKQRGITLCASAKSIDKYRRWYYPLLSGLPTTSLLTDKEVKDILGFEDRHYYSDHKIQSSTFVKSIDAWNLTSYLEELKEIKYFVYKADNLSFIKTLEGEVETEHHSAIKVDTTGTIL